MRPAAAGGSPPPDDAATPAAPQPYVTGAAPYAPQSPYESPYESPYAQAPYAQTPYGQPPAYPLDEPPGFDVDFARDVIERTSRLTVAFRLILAIPHLVAFALLALAGELLVVVAWFAALFLARVPADLYTAIAWVVAYGTRVWSYVFLLTDKWPRFHEEATDPVTVRRPGPGRLNRAAVFFRFVLGVPTAIVAQLVVTGVVLLSPIVWLVTLALGRLPQPLFDGVASAARYQTRYFAYMGLLTARYPSGLFSDDGEPVAGLPDEPKPVGRPPSMNRGARTVVVVLLVLGVLGFVGQIVAESATGNDADKAQRADDALADAYQSMHVSSAAACIGTRDEIGCVTENARQDAGTIRTFAETLSDIDFPSDSDISSDVRHLRSVTDEFVADLDQLSTARSLQDYQRIASERNLEQVGNDFDDAVHTLDGDLQSYANGL